MQTSQTPLLLLSFKISPSIYRACNLMMGERIKKRNMPRTLVLGSLFSGGALAFLFYLLFYLHHRDNAVIVMSVLLLLLGVFNLIYYPLLFRPMLEKRAEKRYESDPYFKEAVLLEFYPDYLEETAGGRKNRIQWTQVKAVERGENLYLLRLTANNGILIPTAGLEARQRETLESLLEEKLAGVKAN